MTTPNMTTTTTMTTTTCSLQVTDTPGLLARPDDVRNAMELLTLAALEHLPSSVLFVADLTEECGTSVREQWAIREELRRRYPDKPWLDALSKADLLGDVWSRADAAAAAGGGGVPGDVQDAEDFARALPNAVRVSSLTQQGLQKLQTQLLEVLSSPVARAQTAAGAALLPASDDGLPLMT